MADRVSIERRNDIALVLIDKPPSNVLTAAIRAALLSAFDQLEQDTTCRAIVIAGVGKTFPSGEDLSEIDTPDPAAIGLGALCRRIELCDRPVIAALHGMVMGAGFELALACHYRVACAGTRLGFPDVRLGLIPGAGGTQRAPRLAGASNALALLLNGLPVLASSPMGDPYVDTVVGRDGLEGAVAFARDLLQDGGGPRRTSDADTGLIDPAAFQGAVATQRRATEAAPDLAPREIVNCVEAALLLPFEAGLALEEAVRESYLATGQSRALRHVFRAGRLCALPPSGQARPVSQLGIAGDGALAVALSAAALEHGLALCHLAPSDAAQVAVTTAIRTGLDRAVAARRISRADRTSRLERLVSATEAPVIAGCDVVIGCGPDHAPLLTAGGSHALPNACIVTTHLFDLVDDSPLLGLALGAESALAELLWSDETMPDDLATLMALLRRIGRVPVAQKSIRPLSRAAVERMAALSAALLAQGVEGAVIRAAAAQDGITWPVADTRAAPVDAAPDQAWARRFLVAGMASYGMGLLRDGVLMRASDLDILAVTALGYPRRSGGPMHMAEATGLLRIERDIAAFAQLSPGLFQPDPGLTRLIKNGQGWADWR